MRLVSCVLWVEPYGVCLLTVSHLVPCLAPETKDPIESAREIYSEALGQAQDEEFLRTRALVEKMGGSKAEDVFLKMPLDSAREAAKTGDVFQAVIFLEKAKADETEKWKILAQALEESANVAERMIRKATDERRVIIPGLKSGAENDRKEAEILRQAVEKLKGSKN